MLEVRAKSLWFRVQGSSRSGLQEEVRITKGQLDGPRR